MGYALAQSIISLCFLLLATKRDSRIKWTNTGVADFVTQKEKHGAIDPPKAREYEPMVRSLGVSNFSADDIYELFDEKTRMDVSPVCNQVELHPGLPQSDS